MGLSRPFRDLFVDAFFFNDGLHLMLFLLYAPLLAIYIRNFTYLCIMVWLHRINMIYFFFSKLFYAFFGWPIFWVGSNNTFFFFRELVNNIVEDVVTIFHQADRQKSVVFIAMIHLVRYIYFCFDVILYHPVGSHDWRQISYFSIDIWCAMWHLKYQIYFHIYVAMCLFDIYALKKWKYWKNDYFCYL